VSRESKITKPRLVVVTGAARGLGVGICQQVLDQDSNSEVVVAARRFEDAERVSSELGARATPLQLDVNSDASCREAARKISELRQGRALSLVNNAGIVLDNPTWSPTPWPASNAKESLGVNLFAVKRIIEALLPQLTDTGEGRIVMVSSGGSWKNLNKMSAEKRAELLSNELSWQDIEESCRQFIKDYETAAQSQSEDKSTHLPYLSPSGFWLQSYGFSKICLNAYCRYLARSYPSVLSVCCAPGLVNSQGITLDSLPPGMTELPQMKTVYEGGDVPAWLACVAEVETGCFYQPDRSKFVRKRKD